MGNRYHIMKNVAILKRNNQFYLNFIFVTNTISSEGYTGYYPYGVCSKYLDIINCLIK